MALKDFDFKQFMIEKGERVGLGVAGVVAVLLIGWFLFWPGHGVFSKNPTELAADLDKKAKDAEVKLRNSQPGAADLPKDPDKPPIDFAVFTLKAGEALYFTVAGWFHADPKTDSKRRNPELLTPDSGLASVELAQLQTYILSNNGKGLYVLKDDKNKNTPTKTNPLQNLIGARGIGANQFGQGRLMMPINNTLAAPEGVAPKKMELVPIEKLGDMANIKPAQTVRPLRMAVLALSFPYEAELKEYMRTLRLGSYNAVLGEPSEEVEEGQQGKLPAFRFLGVNVERRIVDVTGKPLTNQHNRAKDGWEKIDVETSFKPWVMVSGKRIQQDEKDLDPIELDGLVMPRLLQAREGQYRMIERELPLITDTLEKLKKVKPDQPIALPQQFNQDTLNVFSKSGAVSTKAGPAGVGKVTNPGAQGSEAFRPNLTTTGPNDKNAPAPVTPHHCLIRLVDVTIKPGTIYQYRVQVRMANPNFKRTDVANPKYAEHPELGQVEVNVDGKKEWVHEDRWYQLPDNVSVPPERLYYAVDQKQLDLKDTNLAKDYRCVGFSTPYDSKHQAVFQIHRWLEDVAPTKREFTPVGEWGVAERIVVNRGEYIGRPVRIEVPVWMSDLDGFHLAANNLANRRINGIEVDFGSPVNEAILVDYEGGKLEHQRPGGVKVQEDTTVETLILSSDGRLLAHDSRSDTNNAERKNRVQAWRDRIKDVKEQKTGDTKPMGSPFGK
jgi:hypothetical protein